MRHLLNIDDLNKDDIDHIMRLATDAARGHFYTITDKILATIFFEPSTRTKLSFQSAMYRLGGNVIDLPSNSSKSKGETDEDTIKVISEYADLLVIRHPQEVMEKLAAVSSKPVISAGEAHFEHPTQALLDLYTIRQYKNNKDKITIMFTGDLYFSRTVNSLVEILKKDGKQCDFIFTNETPLTEPNWTIIKEHQIDDYLDKVDVLYMTRGQKERWVENFDGDLLGRSKFVLSKDHLYKMKADAIVMHPLPRNGEIHPDVDDNYRAKYFKQVRNGLYVRMAIILYILKMSH